MDWKYKHFNQEAVFKSSRESVLEAARTVAAESLAGFEDRADGFAAQGRSGWHNLIATFRITPAPDGTQVAVELLVERVGGWRGYMLFDVGGYYEGQIRKWLRGIARQLGQDPLSMSRPSIGHGCLMGCIAYLFVGIALTLCAVPFDRAVFPQTSSSTPGPFVALAAAIGLLAGTAAFLSVMFPDASIWRSIRERLPGTRKKEGQ